MLAVFWVYVLMSETVGKRYVGQADDLERRVAEHNDPDHNPCKFTTRHPGPWTLAHSETFSTRALAMRREKWLKSGVGREWLDQQVGRAGPPRAD